MSSWMVFVLLFAAVAAEPRIIGGRQVIIQDYPYSASLQLDGSHICGACVVSAHVILTAAHCIRYDGKMYSVRVGSTYSNKGGVLVHVKEAINHPKFSRSFSTGNDISVLLLKTPLNLTTADIRPIPLPRPNVSPRTGSVGVVTGWGTTDIKDSRSLSKILKKAYLPIWDLNKCKAVYPPNAISDGTLCAGNTKKREDSCTGDSGGPMVADGHLVGLVSWGMSCADTTTPGVYTDVSKYVMFISKYTNQGLQSGR